MWLFPHGKPAIRNPVYRVGEGRGSSGGREKEAGVRGGEGLICERRMKKEGERKEREEGRGREGGGGRGERGRKRIRETETEKWGIRPT